MNIGDQVKFNGNTYKVIDIMGSMIMIHSKERNEAIIVYSQEVIKLNTTYSIVI